MDAAVLIAMTSCILHDASPSRVRFLQPLTPEEEFAVVGSAKTIRWQLSSFYFASGF